MIKKKNSFLTFCFSLLPGAGQMYMGFMKRGISLMSAFFLMIFLSTWLGLSPLMFIMPVIWFYSFFDVFNLRAMTDADFNAMEDDYILFPDFTKEKSRMFQNKYRNVIAGALIVVGITILWNNIYDLSYRLFPRFISNFIYSFGHYIPQVMIGFAIIAFGIYLIRGKKKELDLLEDKGGVQG